MRQQSRPQLTLLPGARELLAAHRRELPQRDDLCGAFCTALALNAAGLGVTRDGQPLDQDAVALAAGSIVSAQPNVEILPLGERGRRDYRLSIPTVEDSEVSGTTAHGLLHAVAQLTDGALVAIPCSGAWTAATLDGLFDAACRPRRPVSLVANLATHHLWGSRPSVSELLGNLYDGRQEGPPPDWRVGHFACIVGRFDGPGGCLYCLADTYPSLGIEGLHLQPRERLVLAVERLDMPAGGIIVVASAEDAGDLRAAIAALGLSERPWDNGTVAAETLR